MARAARESRSTLVSNEPDGTTIDRADFHTPRLERAALGGGVVAREKWRGVETARARFDARLSSPLTQPK